MQKTKCGVINQSYNTSFQTNNYFVFYMYQSLESCRKTHMELQTVVTTTLAFIIAHVFTLLRSLFCHRASSYYVGSFNFTSQDSFEQGSSLSLQGRADGNELPQFCLSENALILPYLSRTVLLDIGFLVVFFFFSTLIKQAHCFLVSIVSDEKTAK